MTSPGHGTALETASRSSEVEGGGRESHGACASRTGGRGWILGGCLRCGRTFRLACVLATRQGEKLTRISRHGFLDGVVRCSAGEVRCGFTVTFVEIKKQIINAPYTPHGDHVENREKKCITVRFFTAYIRAIQPVRSVPTVLLRVNRRTVGVARGGIQ